MNNEFVIFLIKNTIMMVFQLYQGILLANIVLTFFQYRPALLIRSERVHLSPSKAEKAREAINFLSSLSLPELLGPSSRSTIEEKKPKGCQSNTEDTGWSY